MSEWTKREPLYFILPLFFRILIFEGDYVSTTGTGETMDLVAWMDGW